MPLETPLLEMHRAAGADFGEMFGTLLPARFGRFHERIRRGTGAVALVDTNFRALFSFSGPDAQRYLNAILTSNVRDLKPGAGVVGLLLTPQGHILAEVETFLLDKGILTSSHAMVRERTFSTFDKFIIMDDVTMEDVTPATGTLDLVGPLAATVISEIAGVDLAGLPASLAHRSNARFFALPGGAQDVGRPSCRNDHCAARESSGAVAGTGIARARPRRIARGHGCHQFDSPRMGSAVVRPRLRRKEYSA